MRIINSPVVPVRHAFYARHSCARIWRQNVGQRKDVARPTWLAYDTTSAVVRAASRGVGSLRRGKGKFALRISSIVAFASCKSMRDSQSRR